MTGESRYHENCEAITSDRKAAEDAKDNVAFERCVDVITSMIVKYGPALKRRWALNDWIKNIQAERFWKEITINRIYGFLQGVSNSKIRLCYCSIIEDEKSYICLLQYFML